MFADDTNLFFSHKDRKTFFNKVNTELKKINDWFLLMLIRQNIHSSTNFKDSDHIPLKLPELKIIDTTK